MNGADRVFQAMRFGPLTCGQIASRTGLTSKYVARVLNKLEKIKMVKLSHGSSITQGPTPYLYQWTEEAKP